MGGGEKVKQGESKCCFTGLSGHLPLLHNSVYFEGVTLENEFTSMYKIIINTLFSSSLTITHQSFGETEDIKCMKCSYNKHM